MFKLLLLNFVLYFAYAAINPALYDLSALDLGSEKIEMSKYKGKLILFVNTASGCGYTPQLAGLEKLYQKYKSKGLVVLGFPSNDFNQEGLSDSEIKKFCKLNYGVTFPLFKTSSVTGKDKNPVYKHLLKSLNEQRVGWNFEKILVSTDGKPLKKYKSSEKPLDGALEKDIVKNLKL